MSSMQSTIPDSFLLQIDRVGSYRLILADQVLLGNAGSASAPDKIQLLGALSREHAQIRRSLAGYTIRPVHGYVQSETRLASSLTAGNQTSKNEAAPEQRATVQETAILEERLLVQGQQISLAPGISFCLQESSPLCRTALIQGLARDRMKDPVDGILLFDHLLILGPGPQANICCPHWPETGALIYRQGQFRFRSPLGQFVAAEAKTLDLEIPLQRYVGAEEMGLYLEPF